MRLASIIALTLGIIVGIFCTISWNMGGKGNMILAYFLKYPAIILTILGAIGVYVTK